MNNPLHSNESAEWYTPSWLIEKARTVLGGEITLDPASSAIANKVVKAKGYFDKHCNGLELAWFGNVLLNPPGRCDDCELRCSCKLPLQFMKHGFDQFYDGGVDNLIYIGYSLSQLKYLHRIWHDSEHVRICILDKRVKFEKPDGSVPSSPTHDNFVMLITEDLSTRTLFDGEFHSQGVILGPV